MEKETQQTQVLDHKLPAVQGDRGEKTVKDDDYVRIIKYTDGTTRVDRKLVRPLGE